LRVMDRRGTTQGEEVQSFTLPSDASAAQVARAHARRLVDRWGLPPVMEPLTLVVSELVGNAVRYGRPPFQLLLRRIGQAVRVDVHDEAADRAPDLSRVATAKDPGAEDSRGLFLVDAVSADIGVDLIPDDGKRVWAVIDGTTRK
jgi:anti-sigma regulatory factor (Ser/Thr protein kinase)